MYPELKELYKSVLTKRYYKREITHVGNKITVKVYQEYFLTIHTFYIGDGGISKYTMSCGTVIPDHHYLNRIVEQ